jgi:hypothetical protein
MGFNVSSNTVADIRRRLGIVKGTISSGTKYFNACKRHGVKPVESKPESVQPEEVQPTLGVIEAEPVLRVVEEASKPSLELVLEVARLYMAENDIVQLTITETKARATRKITTTETVDLQ